MASKRNFFVTTITVKVLSENYPVITDVDLHDLARQVDEGDWVLHSQEGSQEQVTPQKMAELLGDAGSEPGFFRLDDDGNDTED